MIRKSTNALPTHFMYAVARTLKGVGIDLTDLTTYAVDLHDYQYNGFERASASTVGGRAYWLTC